MIAGRPLRLAILYPGDRAARDRASTAESRFLPLFKAFESARVSAEPAVYSDEFRSEVREQLGQVDGVLVWHNPIESGRDRSLLDDMLRDVASGGVMVSAHPDTILKLGTKDVLLSVRDLPFGTDAYRVDSLLQVQTQVLARVAGGARVLKQRRGHSGLGVWRIEQRDATHYAVRHAQRGSVEELVDLAGVLQRLAPYFESGGHMIDQAWQPRMVEGMTRAYLVRDRVGGFGHQAVVALYPAGEIGEALQPGPRLYSDAEDARFHGLRQNLERQWVGLLCERVGLDRSELPLLWDADFLLGNRAVGAAERHVLCEINASSVSPFPESAIQPLVEATRQALRHASGPGIV
jgi:hypothetical protein